MVFLWSAYHEILYHVHHGKMRFPQIYLGFSRSTRARPGRSPQLTNLGRSVRPLGGRTPFAALVGTLLTTRRTLRRRSIRILTGDITSAFATHSPIDSPELLFLGRKEHSASPSKVRVEISRCR